MSWNVKKYKIKKQRICRLNKNLKSNKIHKQRLRNWQVKSKNNDRKRQQITAPDDLRLFYNTPKCVSFFKELIMSGNNTVAKNRKNRLFINLKYVEHIDFASTIVLKAIGDELVKQNIGYSLSGNMPKNKECARYLKDSGFLNEKHDIKGQQFPYSKESSFMKIEKGENKFSKEHMLSLVDVEEKIFKHVFTSEGKNIHRISMLKEICGNSIEWSNIQHPQWTLGVKFEQGKVLVVALDLGVGILNSLKDRYANFIKDLLIRREYKSILSNAFDKKYGSNTQEVNRNKGLPSIKFANQSGIIKNLRVLTNNVCLDFNDPKQSSEFYKRVDEGFNGTLYCWEIDNACIK